MHDISEAEQLAPLTVLVELQSVVVQPNVLVVSRMFEHRKALSKASSFTDLPLLVLREVGRRSEQSSNSSSSTGN